MIFDSEHCEHAPAARLYNRLVTSKACLQRQSEAIYSASSSLILKIVQTPAGR
jgi:hypothetical protein